MKWSVQLSEEADSDLRGIYDYLAFCLFAPDTARRQARRIMSSIKNLDEQPLRFPRYSEEPWLSLGYRFYSVGSYLVFYLPIEETKTVRVLRVVYSGRDIHRQLNESLSCGCE